MINFISEERIASYNGTIRKGDVFTAKSKILGQYGLVLDTIAPIIKIAKPIEGKWISDMKKIRVYN